MAERMLETNIFKQRLQAETSDAEREHPISLDRPARHQYIWKRVNDQGDCGAHMAIKLIIAVTDGDWFEMLRQKRDLAEVNFWAPSSNSFKALRPGELFLFKLHAPRNFIVGGGVFAHANALPCSLAWAAFGEANGARSSQEMRARIAKYRRADPGDRSDFAIGCRILTQPFFFDEADWIPVPDSWSPNIVSFKTYNTADSEGLKLWDAVHERMNRPLAPGMTDPAARWGSRNWLARASAKAPSACWSQTSIGGAARSRTSGHSRRWKRRTSAPMPMAARTKRATGFCFAAISTASLTPDMSR